MVGARWRDAARRDGAAKGEEQQEQEKFVFGAFREPRYRLVLGLVGMIVLSFLAVMLSMSRGGMLSLMVASLAIALLASRQRVKEGGWIISAVLLVVFCALLYAGFDSVCDRLATLYNRPDPTSGRLQTDKDILGIIPKFPLFGIGLGTHEKVYPMFDHSHDANLPESADNDWLQVFEETGTIGGVLVVAFVVGIGTYFVRLVRRRRNGIYLATYGMGFGLIAVMLNSCTDFGQHLPAVGALSAIFCAILINLSRLRDQERVEKDRVAGRPIKEKPFVWTAGIVRRGSLAAIVIGLGWAIIGARRATAGAIHWDRVQAMSARLREKNWAGGDAEFRAALIEASAATAIEPENVDYRFALNGLRWAAISRPTKESPGSRKDFSSTALGIAQRIADDLKVARSLCPTFGLPCSLEGQIEFYTLRQPQGADRIRQAYLLYPNHPRLCYDAAVVDAYGGDWNASLETFSRCVELDAGTFAKIVNFLIEQTNRSDLAVSLAMQRKDVTELLQVLSELERHPQTGSEAERTRQAAHEAMEFLRRQSLPDETPASKFREMADICLRENDDPGAIRYLKRAVAKDYADAEGHFLLAQLLDKQGQTMDAVDELRICLRLQPGMENARKLLADLSLRPTFIPEH